MKPITIKPRSDTEENWIKNNPILEQNEICIVYTKSYGAAYKIGNGCSHYNHLPFVSLERVLEEGLMYVSNSNMIVRFKGFIKETEETNEQVHCPREFIW